MPSRRNIHTSAALLVLLTSTALGQKTFPATPLASKTFAYPSGIPYQADTEPELIRGRQWGYNICNSTTEGQSSLCQTSFFNSIEDFCLWGPLEPNSLVGDSEGESVAWCTRPGHGTRLIPAGALQGVQFVRTPDYIQVAGFVDQTKLNIADGDYGGELDPHGADLRGNPLGGLMYSNAWSGGGDNYQQVIEWTLFIGANAFCFKACDPAGQNDDKFCEHIYDRIGCKFNMPNQAANGTFEACSGENQDYPGIYTENGQVMTYTLPGEGIEPNPTYTPKMPASSDCTTYTSSELFSALLTVTPPGSTPTGTPGSDASGSITGGSGGSPGTNPTRTSGGTRPTASDGSEGAASRVVAMGAMGLVGVVLSVLVLA